MNTVFLVCNTSDMSDKMSEFADSLPINYRDQLTYDNYKNLFEINDNFFKFIIFGVEFFDLLNSMSVDQLIISEKLSLSNKEMMLIRSLGCEIVRAPY